MNCRAFERDLSEWIAERLPIHRAARMQAHYAACPACQQAAQSERILRRQWQQLPSPDASFTLWPRLAERIASAKPLRRPAAWRPAAFGGMVAATALCSFLLWMRSDPTSGELPAPSAETMVADERPIVQRMNRMRQMPEDESGTFFSENEDRKQSQRLLLLGKEGQ